ncbi:hypothetical protein [Rhodococcus qingshengii]|uniref:hypothetical protein n=1 Tax=Rhodococcus qingshengii TaxID=334542 RepID=UPI0021B129DA|nr:hypothetical protein [Rhodococcus qingshengii]MCT6735270.1 hypothetical protein [Rhodococcus qingshengii]
MTNHDNRIQLPIGTRIFNKGERHPEVRREGAATITEVVRQCTDGTWEYRVRDDNGDIRVANIVGIPVSEETRKFFDDYARGTFD